MKNCFIDNKIRWDAEDITDAQEFIQGAREEAEAQEIRIELNGELSDYGNMYLGYGTMFFDDVIVDNKGMILLDQVSNGWKFYDFDF